MSAAHPIIAVTGSSGAGTSTARRVFERLFDAMGLSVAYIEGDSFHAYDREQMDQRLETARIRGENFSHFGPSANHFERLERLFREYSTHGTGFCRRYLHSEQDAQRARQTVGTFTPWESLPANTDVLFYEGLHGGVVTSEVNVARHVDLLIGVTPTINLEWIQKIRRDRDERGHAREDVTRTILRRMPDYVNFITPQFSRTDVNFQRVPLVDTSNPFGDCEIPDQAESLVVVHFNPGTRLGVTAGELAARFSGAFLSRATTVVVPGGLAEAATHEILRPALQQLLRARPAPAGAADQCA